MQFNLKREVLLKPLQYVNAPLGNRPAFPILGNLLLSVEQDVLVLTSADLEIEIVVRISLTNQHKLGRITTPARKFFDICRGLPEGVEITVLLEGDKILIVSGRSRFSLATLPASSFPNLDDWQSEVELSISQRTMKQLIEATHFSMAHQDVRYYLNGILLETDGKELCAVATDGHRLAQCSMPVEQVLPRYSVIIPRKGVAELLRILNDSTTAVQMQFGKNHIRVSSGNLIFTSKLIDGSFPDYRRIFLIRSDSILKVNCDLLKQACIRVSILANCKLRSVCLVVNTNYLKITANNSDQEEAEEILDVMYNGSQMEIGLNVSYIIDVLNALKCDMVYISLIDSVSRVQIADAMSSSAKYIIMPMRV
ncbi:DNA polymerase III subunit beta [Candidatus Erwinia haradaeae]|uniref:Beta sliding clamp n=1 Tax=Candidatus Erwinia haradaeae TaxID=1922217 RepID=A0A451D9C7_9GAMM|nr:DNA polymerase III subunit beta [Candidatus Erwinia haradaeae]VFP82833.1 Beta sliding clamp [Candidatus Erwinia haradaeae]